LEIIKLVSSKKAYVGEDLTWTIIVINHGPSAALDVKVLEDIPDSLRLVSYTATKGTFDKNTNIWTIGKLDNASTVTLTIVTRVLSVGNITNPVDVNSSTPDSNKTNNHANNTTEASELCDLAIMKTSDYKVYYVGDNMHWIIEVVNYGPSPARGVWVSDVMPSGVKFISCSASKGNYDKAIADYLHAIRINKYSSDAYYNMGLTHCKLKQYDDALEDFNKAIELNPNYSLAYFHRGLVYLELDNQQFAKSDFQKARQLDPKNKEIKEHLDNLNKQLNKMLEYEEFYY
jgi:uncharacterized repeat protein (TIGR01451 family)